MEPLFESYFRQHRLAGNCTLPCFTQFQDVGSLALLILRGPTSGTIPPRFVEAVLTA